MSLKALRPEIGKDRSLENNKVTLDEIENELRPERIVISPGPGTPDDAGLTLDPLFRMSELL